MEKQGDTEDISSVTNETQPAAPDAAAVLERAVEVIGEREEAYRWMGTPVRALAFATPVSRLATEPGRQEVLAVLDRLEHGVL